MRILVAEDETIIRLDLRGLLERAGYDVVAEARDGEEAVELARLHEPDLALMDVKMPRLDGIEAARRMLEERPIPIVMLTAFDQRELVERAAEAGVYGYLVKPFREQDVVPALLQHHRHGGSGGAAPGDDDVARAGAGHHTHAAFCATASSPYGKTRRMRTGIPASAKAVANSSAVKARRIERAPSATLTRDRRSKGKSDRANT